MNCFKLSSKIPPLKLKKNPPDIWLLDGIAVIWNNSFYTIVMGNSKNHMTKAIIMTNALVLTAIAIVAIYFFFFAHINKDPSLTRLLYKCKTCQQAKDLALNDFKNRNYQVVTWGLIFSDSPTIKIAEILERDYQIKTIFGGCITVGEIECYDLEMRKLLVLKYGNSFYKKANDEARKNSP